MKLRARTQLSSTLKYLFNACITRRMRQKTRTYAVRVNLAFHEAIERYVAGGTYLNKSDFIRAAIREKLLRDAPELLGDVR